MVDESMRRRVAEAIARGKLPARLPRKSWAGQGSGGICAFCEKPITAEQLENEFPDSENPTRTYHLHLRCWTVCESALAANSIEAEPSLLAVPDGSYSPADECSFGEKST